MPDLNPPYRNTPQNGETLDSVEPSVSLAPPFSDRPAVDVDSADGLAQPLSGLPTMHMDPGLVEEVYRTVDPLAREGSRYRIHSKHARGGLGVVYRAIDTELERTIALKEMRPEVPEEYRESFQREARITGNLEHPGIVPVYGLGVYADGRPFYAMRFIEGHTLREAIEARHADDPVEFRNLLSRFVAVCNALEYAHSRSIIHRDLKPENIMLGRYGETLVIDWGLARTVGSADPDDGRNRLNLPPSADGATQEGRVKGTPVFMAPEQAEGRISQLDAATDIYGLGATFYVLLTGQDPFGGRTVSEVVEKVRLGSFQPPVRIAPSVPAALSAICCKAMARVPADRYVSAAALAEDIERFLADVPTLAYREPLVARVGRWMRKHPGTVSAITATVLVGGVSLALGLFVVREKNSQLDGLNVSLRQTNDDLDIANSGLQSSNVALDRSRAAAEKARDVARANFGLALDAFNAMVSGFQTKLEDRPGTQELRKDLLENARKGLQKLIREAEKNSGADRTLLHAHLQMGDLYQDLGDIAAAKKERARAVQLAADRVADSPADPEARRDLAVAKTQLGHAMIRGSEARGAMAVYLESHEIFRALAADAGDARAAADLTSSFDYLGVAAMRLGDTAKALDYQKRSLLGRERVARERPEDPTARRELGLSLERLAEALIATGDTSGAAEKLRECLAIREALAAAAPASIEARRTLALTYKAIGPLYLLLGDGEKCLEAVGRSLAICRALAEEEPKSAVARAGLAAANYQLGTSLVRLARVGEAAERLTECVEIRRKLADADPENLDKRRLLTLALLALGDTTVRLGELRKTFEYYRDAAEGFRQLLLEDPTDTTFLRDLAVALERMGDVSLRLGRFDEAVSNYNQCKDISRQQVEADPKNARARRNLAVALERMSEVAMRRGDFSQARYYLTSSRAMREKLVADDPRNIEGHRELVRSHELTANLERDTGRFAEAIEAHKAGIEAATKSPRPEPLAPQVDLMRRAVASCEYAAKAVGDLDAVGRQPEATRAATLEQLFPVFLTRRDVATARAVALRYAEGAKTGPQFYDAGCFFARLSVWSDGGAKEADAKKAIELLREAVAGGYRDPMKYRRDADFDWLRDRDDFKALLAGMEAKKK